MGTSIGLLVHRSISKAGLLEDIQREKKSTLQTFYDISDIGKLISAYSWFEMMQESLTIQKSVYSNKIKSRFDARRRALW